MNDEFQILRPAIFICAGIFVFAFILNVCHESARQRAQFTSAWLATAHGHSASNGSPKTAASASRVCPAGALPRGSFELAAPSAD